MKLIIMLIALCMSGSNAQAQLLNKLKQKAEKEVNKTIDKTTESKTAGNAENKGEATDEENTASAAVTPDGSTAGLKVFSKFDFVPGSTILYFDNFENDNTGETPAGWITSASAEVVSIEGLEGNWVKMATDLSRHFIRTKKQSWGDNFTIEFDLLIQKKLYSPRINFMLSNTLGLLVTDENILTNVKRKDVIKFETIVGGEPNSTTPVTRTTLSNADKKLADNMKETLSYSNTQPVHVSICVQGKRFRMWWNDKKIYDLQAMDVSLMPNQLGFFIGSEEFYISNIRIAKDVPDTRALFEEGKLISNLLFYAATAKLKPESMGSLLDVSKILKDATEPVKIVGHTDSDGQDAANLKLSEQRAKTVKDILVSTYSIDADKLTTEGRGETQPLADNKSTEGKAQNRRVEFIFKAAADKYEMSAGLITGNTKTVAEKNKTASSNTGTSSSGTARVSLQSKILTTSLPYAQFMKSGESGYTFIASKEEGNSKENYFKVELTLVNTTLKPGTFNFAEINKKNPLYGTKKYADIKSTEAVLHYGAGKKPYIYQFSPIIANGTMASYVDEGLIRNLPDPSAASEFVIEKVENGKASGYFIAGIMTEGLKPVTKGDAMRETFTTGFSGQLKCTFSDVPVY